MSIEIARAFLRERGYEDRIREFEVSSATVELAAKAAGVEPARICKTLSFKLKDGSGVLIQAAGDARIDNKKYKAYFGEKLKCCRRRRSLNIRIMRSEESARSGSQETM